MIYIVVVQVKLFVSVPNIYLHFYTYFIGNKKFVDSFTTQYFPEEQRYNLLQSSFIHTLQDQLHIGQTIKPLRSNDQVPGVIVTPCPHISAPGRPNLSLCGRRRKAGAGHKTHSNSTLSPL